MELNELIKKVDALKAELDKLKPIKPEYQKKLDEKIRLEFNYNSNHLEGNTLNIGETMALLIFDEHKGGHNSRDYNEMQGHDVAFKLIKTWAADKQQPLTEAIIKNLNQLILKEPFQKEAETSEGQKTTRLIKIGDYKELPNNVRLLNGETFEFASPTDTPIKMGELIQWYRKEEDSKELHPSVLASLFHYRFVLIHPFDDGNGRISRLLMNYVLLKNNLPPIIIKSSDKKNYLSALHNADTGDIDSFVEYMLNQLVWSLELSINGAKTGNFEEEGDLDKEIDLLKRKAKSGNKINVEKSREVIQNVYRSSLQNLFVEIERQLSTFDELFFKKDIRYEVQHPVVTNKLKSSGGNLSYVQEQIFFDIDNAKRRGEVPENLQKVVNWEVVFSYPDINTIRVTFGWKKYQSVGVNAFDVYKDIEVYFSDTKYIIGGINGAGTIKQKLYNEILSNEEVIEIASIIKRQVLGEIKEGLERANIK